MSCRFTVAANPAGGFIHSPVEGAKETRRGEDQSWGPEAGGAGLGCKCRSVWHPGPCSFHYLGLGLCPRGACEWPQVFLLAELQ